MNIERRMDEFCLFTKQSPAMSGMPAGIGSSSTPEYGRHGGRTNFDFAI